MVEARQPPSTKPQPTQPDLCPSGALGSSMALAAFSIGPSFWGRRMLVLGRRALCV